MVLINQNVGVVDPWLEHAIDNILADFGDNVSLKAKNKDLLKFGRNTDVETEIATIMTLPDGIDNETYVATNIITTISSDDGDDTEVMKIEGHTISGSDLTFVVQTATLNGLNKVVLSTPLARCTRMYANGSTDLVGTIYVYEDGDITLGVPNTDAEVHLMIRAGMNQSEKASTSISSVDYWVITKFHADMLTKAASFAEVDLEVRLSGGVFRQIDDVSCSDSHAGNFPFKPYHIVPPNSDVRLRGVSDNASGRDVSASIEGVLLKA